MLEIWFVSLKIGQINLKKQRSIFSPGFLENVLMTVVLCIVFFLETGSLSQLDVVSLAVDQVQKLQKKNKESQWLILKSLEQGQNQTQQLG